MQEVSAISAVVCSCCLQCGSAEAKNKDGYGERGFSPELCVSVAHKVARRLCQYVFQNISVFLSAGFLGECIAC